MDTHVATLSLTLCEHDCQPCHNMISRHEQPYEDIEDIHSAMSRHDNTVKGTKDLCSAVLLHDQPYFDTAKHKFGHVATWRRLPTSFFPFLAHFFAYYPWTIYSTLVIIISVCTLR